MQTSLTQLAAASTHELFVLDRQIANLMAAFVDDPDRRRELIRDRKAVRDELSRRVAANPRQAAADLAAELR